MKRAYQINDCELPFFLFLGYTECVVYCCHPLSQFSHSEDRSAPAVRTIPPIKIRSSVHTNKSPPQKCLRSQHIKDQWQFLP
uniref:Uncharacterized protein n=1 Tax=Anguilla anguilla TaxID=7936 RepID=A0A0E9RZV6_ANGAN